MTQVYRDVIDKYKYLLRQYAFSAELVSEYGIQSNVAMNKNVNTWDSNNHLFRIEYKSIGITDQMDQKKMWALLNAMRGGAVDFKWALPLIGATRIGKAGTNGALVSKAKQPGENRIRMLGQNRDGDLVNVGDVIKLDFHPKCYLVLDCEYSNDPAITLNTPLVKPVTTSDKLITRDPEFTLILDPESDPISYIREAGDLDAGFSCSFVEKLEVPFS